MLKNILSFTLELVKIVVISLVIIVPVRYFLIQPFYVRGASMEPNFHDHEYLIVDEISYRFKDAKRGDILVFRYPNNPSEYFIKRLIGLPGEQIQIKDGQVYIFDDEFVDGTILEEPYLDEGVKTYGLSESKITLGDNEYYVLGDNRNSSKDSRSFGPLNENFLTGKVLFRGWPFDKIQFFSEQEYAY